MNGVTEGRTTSFAAGALETKYPSQNPSLRPVAMRPFTPTSIFDQSQVIGSSNGLSLGDYERRRVGGGFAPSLNGASAQTYGQRLWIDKNPSRTIGG